MSYSTRKSYNCIVKSITIKTLIFVFGLSLCAVAYAAEAPFVTIMPARIVQGEPVMISVAGADAGTKVTGIFFDGVPLGIFSYQGKSAAFAGIDLNYKAGTYPVTVTLLDGRALTADITVDAREKIEAPLGIPEKLGGNTPASQAKLVSSLAAENKALVGLRTGTKAFWAKPFRSPVAQPVVTDEYGYSRKTGAYSIPHKGTDFRAAVGTPVMAINRGVVRVAKEFGAYGKTVVVDHGLGLMSFYMHLSKISVNVGELVKSGQRVGLSGQTGYAASPHLHFTLRIDGVSVDPMKFFILTSP